MTSNCQWEKVCISCGPVPDLWGHGMEEGNNVPPNIGHANITIKLSYSIVHPQVEIDHFVCQNPLVFSWSQTFLAIRELVSTFVCFHKVTCIHIIYKAMVINIARSPDKMIPNICSGSATDLDPVSSIWILAGMSNGTDKLSACC